MTCDQCEFMMCEECRCGEGCYIYNPAAKGGQLCIFRPLADEAAHRGEGSFPEASFHVWYL